MRLIDAAWHLLSEAFMQTVIANIDMVKEAIDQYEEEGETDCLLERNTSRAGRIDTLELLADALGISIDEYVGHKVTKHDKKVVV